MVGVVEDLGMDVVLDYSNLQEAAAGIATAGAVVAAVNDDHNHLVAAIMEALGPRGRGFVAVRGVPHFRELRDKLLPLAKEIALMPEAQLPSFLRAHGLGTDVSLKHRDRPVSSFAAKLKFEDAIGGMIFIILSLSWVAVASFFSCHKQMVLKASGFIESPEVYPLLNL
jgi:hypothetical protein